MLSCVSICLSVLDWSCSAVSESNSSLRAGLTIDEALNLFIIIEIKTIFKGRENRKV
jgi:hypothetical protein